MSEHDSTPQKDPAAQEQREITVQVPAHRVAQFERVYARFIAMAAQWESEIGNEDLRGPRGRRGRHRHGGRPHGHGRCGSRREADVAPDAAA